MPDHANAADPIIRRLAKDLGVSFGKVKRAQRIKAASRRLFNACFNGKLTLADAERILGWRK